MRLSHSSATFRLGSRLVNRSSKYVMTLEPKGPTVDPTLCPEGYDQPVGSAELRFVMVRSTSRFSILLVTRREDPADPTPSSELLAETLLTRVRYIDPRSLRPRAPLAHIRDYELCSRCCPNDSLLYRTESPLG